MKRFYIANLVAVAIFSCLLCTLPGFDVDLVSAGTIIVNSTDDDGPGTLRRALAVASSRDTINITATGAIVLTSGELVVNKSVDIRGPGASKLIVSGNGVSRVFHITPGTTVSISGISIANGSAGGRFPANAGGGIYSDHAQLTVNNCVLTGNSARFGGAIFSNSMDGRSATLTVNSSTIANNYAQSITGFSGAFGGGIFSGGGFFNTRPAGNASVMLNDSTITGNWAETLGGGIFNDGFRGWAMLTVRNSSIIGNAAYIAGGGIYNNGDSGEAITSSANTTLSDNFADSGAAIYNDGSSSISGGSADVTLSNCTLDGNSAWSGSGIHALGSAAGTTTVNIVNTILNAGLSGSNIFSYDATVLSHGYNLSSDHAGGDAGTGPGGLLNGPGDIRNTNPLLGPLQDNGGPTMTHAPLTHSPAIDAGDPNFNLYAFDPPLRWDQRGTGFPRVFGGRIDIGAVESKEPVALGDIVISEIAFSPETSAPGGLLNLTVTALNDGRGRSQATRVYVSLRAISDLSETFLWSDAISPLTPGSEATVAGTAAVSVPAGAYLVVACVNNNCFDGGQLIVRTSEVDFNVTVNGGSSCPLNGTVEMRIFDPLGILRAFVIRSCEDAVGQALRVVIEPQLYEFRFTLMEDSGTQVGEAAGFVTVEAGATTNVTVNIVCASCPNP